MKRLVARSFRGNLLLEFLLRGKSLFILPVVTRYLGTDGYGEMALVISLAGLVGSVSTLGLPAALGRLLPGARSPQEKGEILWPGIAALSASTALFASAALLAAVLVRPTFLSLGTDLLVVGAINILSNETKIHLFSYYRLTLEVDRYYRWVAADLVLTTTAQLAAILWLKTSVAGVLAASVIVDFTLIVALLGGLLPQVPWVRVRLSFLRPLYAFGLPLTANNLLNWVNNSADRVVIEAHGTSSDVGIYSVGYMLGFSAIALIATPLFSILPAMLFRLWDTGEVERANGILMSLGSYFTAAVIPVLLTVHFFGAPLIRLVAGSAFGEAQHFVLLVGTGYGLMYFGDLFGYPLMLRGKQFAYPVALVIGGCVNIVLNLMLVPTHGPLGAAAATAISFAALTATLVIFNRSYRCPAPQVRPSVLIILLGGATWWGLAFLSGEVEGLAEMVLLGTVATLIFATAVLTTGLIPRQPILELFRERRHGL